MAKNSQIKKPAKGQITLPGAKTNPLFWVELKGLLWDKIKLGAEQKQLSIPTYIRAILIEWTGIYPELTKQSTQTIRDVVRNKHS